MELGLYMWLGKNVGIDGTWLFKNIHCPYWESKPTKAIQVLEYASYLESQLACLSDELAAAKAASANGGGGVFVGKDDDQHDHHQHAHAPKQTRGGWLAKSAKLIHAIWTKDWKEAETLATRFWKESKDVQAECRKLKN